MRPALALLALAACHPTPVGPPRDWSAHPVVQQTDGSAVTVWVCSDVHGGFDRLVKFVAARGEISVHLQPGTVSFDTQSDGEVALSSAGLELAGDSGSGARLGDFEGMTAGVGPVLSYAAKVGRNKTTDLVAEVKWLPELDVNKRLKGDMIWFKLALVF